MVGKKCIRHYAADRVLASFRDAYNCTKTLWRVETQSSTVIYPGEPECQRQWILPVRDATGALTEHTYVQRNCFVEDFSHNHTGSSSSSIRRIWWSLQRVILIQVHGWPELVACCHVRIFGCVFLGQLQSCKQLDAYNYFHCSYVRTILWGNDCCILCWSPVTSHTWQYPPPDIMSGSQGYQ